MLFIQRKEGWTEQGLGRLGSLIGVVTQRCSVPY